MAGHPVGPPRLAVVGRPGPLPRPTPPGARFSWVPETENPAKTACRCACPASELPNKNPRIETARPGDVPFLSTSSSATNPNRGVHRLCCPGRSSDSRILLPAASSHPGPDSDILRLSSPITAAGPFPIFTGFPFQPRFRRGAGANLSSFIERYLTKVKPKMGLAYKPKPLRV